LGLPAWLEAFVPGRGVWLPAGAAAVVVVAAAAVLAGWLKVGRGVRTPYTRKVFHFVIFTAAGVFHVWWGLGAVVVFGCVGAAVVLFAVVRGSGDPLYESLARPSDRPHRTRFVLIPLATTAAGGVLANVLFPGFAHVGYLVCGWGDAVGEPVGTRWGRRRYRVPSLFGVAATRSVEGSAAVLAVGSVAAVLGLLWAGQPAAAAILAGLAVGGAAALVEGFSTHGLDNLTVQLAAAGMAYALLA
jgi:phytol kinase